MALARYVHMRVMEQDRDNEGPEEREAEFKWKASVSECSSTNTVIGEPRKFQPVIDI